MKYSLHLYCLFITFEFAESNPEYITGGTFTTYNLYPHSVFLNIDCEQFYLCGGSILNQDIVLTAAHCTHGCERVENSDINIQVKYGHESILHMKTIYMKNYTQHQDYDDEYMRNDICLISVKNRIPLSDVVKRIILKKNPPAAKYAYVAGWGVDEHQQKHGILKHTSVILQNRKVCQKMGWIPNGTFCAGPVSGLGSAEQGDSGGALVIHHYIQIGIVSFSVEKYSLVAYTNTSYHLEWIEETARNLVC